MSVFKIIFILTVTLVLTAPGLAQAQSRYSRQGFPAGPLDGAIRPAPQWQRQGQDYVRNSRWVNDDGYVIRGEVVYSSDGTTYVRRAPQPSYSRLPGNTAPSRNFNVTSK